MSILAGMAISIGCILYLNIGGVLGAFCFSVGLMSVILYQFKLFTGKAGLLAAGQIKVSELGKIWIGNLIGVFLMSCICIFLPSASQLVDKCKAAMELRAQVGFLGSFLLAIPCGLLMYMAVSAPDNPMKLLYVGMCVMAFIMCGFYHCVADMFYTLAGATTWQQYLNIVFVTAGNMLGCNLIPLIKKLIGGRYNRAARALRQEVHYTDK